MIQHIEPYAKTAYWLVGSVGWLCLILASIKILREN